MANYIQPSQKDFDSAEAVVVNTVTQTAPSIMTKAGAAIRELVVRPLAYILSWITANVSHIRERTSIRYLATSQATENEYADLVAGNFFVTRNSAGRSRGAITLVLSKSTLRIPQGSRFSTNGVALETAKQVLIQPGTLPADTDKVSYVRAIPNAGMFLATIPVVCIKTGAIEVSAGADVSVEFINNVVVSASVTSPITGGMDAETDASMIRRAALNTAEAGIGSSNGIRKKMLNAPVHVSGLMVCAGEDEIMFRARYNNLCISPGGFIDCYVKTQSQVSTMELDLVATADGGSGNFSVFIPSTACPGAIVVTALYAFVDADGDGIPDDGETGGQVTVYDVAYGTSLQATGPQGARLSGYQTITVSFKPANVSLPAGQIISLSDPVACRVRVAYMPGIMELQQFMSSDKEKFIGQDIMVKSAIPAMVSLSCCVSAYTALTEDELLSLKTAMSHYVDGTQVGARLINFSDLAKACASVVPRAELRVPANFTITIPNKENGSSTVWYSDNGIADIANSAIYGGFDYRMCFFSMPVSGITLQEV